MEQAAARLFDDWHVTIISKQAPARLFDDWFDRNLQSYRRQLPVHIWQYWAAVRDRVLFGPYPLNRRHWQLYARLNTCPNTCPRHSAALYMCLRTCLDTCPNTCPRHLGGIGWVCHVSEDLPAMCPKKRLPAMCPKKDLPAMCPKYSGTNRAAVRMSKHMIDEKHICCHDDSQ